MYCYLYRLVFTQVYYDDDDVLCDFWQYFVSEERNFTEPVDIWRRHFTKPFGKAGQSCLLQW